MNVPPLLTWFWRIGSCGILWMLAGMVGAILFNDAVLTDAILNIFFKPGLAVFFVCFVAWFFLGPIRETSSRRN